MIVQQPDSLRRVLDSVFAAPAYRWTLTTSDPFGAIRRAWHALTNWLDNLGVTSPVMYWIITGLLALILLVIVLHIWFTIQRAIAPPDAAANMQSGDEPVRGLQWYRREAERLAHAHRFTDAMQADFMALLLELDARGLVTFHPSKTPAEYLRDARLPLRARRPFQQVVAQLYHCVFAGWPCDATTYVAWRAALSTEQYADAA